MVIYKNRFIKIGLLSVSPFNYLSCLLDSHLDIKFFLTHGYVYLFHAYNLDTLNKKNVFTGNAFIF